jgi:(p)ppGpp synthase/HD superfamily hydrolase
MQKKLTLSIDEDLIKFAHQFSKETNQSISKMVEEYLLQLKKQNNDYNVNPRIKNLYGIFEDQPIPDKKELRKMFHDKSNYRS